MATPGLTRTISASPMRVSTMLNLSQNPNVVVRYSLLPSLPSSPRLTATRPMLVVHEPLAWPSLALSRMVTPFLPTGVARRVSPGPRPTCRACPPSTRATQAQRPPPSWTSTRLLITTSTAGDIRPSPRQCPSRAPRRPHPTSPRATAMHLRDRQEEAAREEAPLAVSRTSANRPLLVDDSPNSSTLTTITTILILLRRTTRRGNMHSLQQLR